MVPGKPDPVRSYQTPWAMAGLQRKNQVMVAEANSLLQVALRFFAAAAASNAHAIIEHPADWFEENVPSIFRLPEVTWLRTWPSCRYEIVDQCCGGAPHKKPTKLIVAGLPTLRAGRLPHHGRCPGKP